MTTAATVVALLELDSRGFQKGMKTAGGSMDAFSTKMKNIGAGMMKFGGAMTLGLTLPIVAFAASSVKSFTEAESAVADLEAVLKSTGQAAGVTLDELTAHASALQNVTKFSDEAVMSAQGMLLTFTKIGKEVFPEATEMALNMAEKFGMDASQASITLGKALNDPIAGVGALRRIGVMLTDEQEKSVKAFMAVGDVAGAQAIIMKELNVEIGGVARAMGETSAGKMEQFKNKLDDMKEIIGGAIVPVIMRLMEAVTPLIERFAAASPQMQNFIMILGVLFAAAGPVLTVLGGLVTAIGTLIPIVTAVAGAFGTIAAAVSGAIVPILIIIGVIGALVAAVLLVYLAFKNNFMGIRTIVKKAWAGVKPIFDKIAKGWAMLFPRSAKILKGFKDFFTGIRSGLTMLYEDGSGLLLDLAVSFGIPEKAAQKFLATVFDVVGKVKAAWANMTGGGDIKPPDMAPATKAIEDYNAAVESTGETQEAMAARMEMMSDKNTTFISSLQSYSSFQQGYEEDHLEAVGAIKTAQEELNEAVKKYGRDSEEALSAREGFDAARANLQELENSWHTATATMVFDMIQAQFMFDGILSDVESKALVEFGIRSGLFTEEQAKYTQTLLDQAAAFVDGTHQSEAYKNEMGAATAATETATGAVQTLGAELATVTSQTLGAIEAINNLGARSGQVLGDHQRGLSSMSSIPRPTSTFSPDAGGGMGGSGWQPITINVTNPKSESSEESIRKNLKALSFTGVLNR